MGRITSLAAGRELGGSCASGGSCSPVRDTDCSARSRTSRRGAPPGGIPDPITWIRCRVVMYLVDLHFELDLNSAEFQQGVKQALVHVSNLMSSGRYHSLVGIVSSEVLDG
ncbi:m-AAA protease-interacting protein 1, mitochondrial [Lycodopsis pacificus]